MSSSINIESVNGTMVIRFVRPEIRNPLSLDVLLELEIVLDRLEKNKQLQRIIFTGDNGVFASGADLREIKELSSADAPAFSRLGQRLMDRIERLQVSTIAAINGYCYGGALDLALACRMRIGTADSTYCHPGAGLGIITGWGGTQRLPRLVGETNALNLFFTATAITAQEALRIGLINEIVADPVTAVLSFSRQPT